MGTIGPIVLVEEAEDQGLLRAYIALRRRAMYTRRRRWDSSPGSRQLYVIDEEWEMISVLAVRKRPPYTYADLGELLGRA
jgi:hypothetical protein